MAGYSSDRIKLTAIPSPHKRGEWWVHSWTVTVPGEDSLEDFKFPEPHTEEPVMFLTLLRSTRDVVLLEIFERGQIISPGALVFASQIVNAMRTQFGSGVAVDGDMNNPLFLVVRHE